MVTLLITYNTCDNKSSTVREICFSTRLRKMILLRRVNGVGGNNKNCWNLFYRCTGLKICFWYICTPGGKLGITACCQIIVFLRLFFISFSHITQILLKLGNWDLSHIVGFFILYKMKKKFFSIFIFFIKIYPVFFIENG